MTDQEWWDQSVRLVNCPLCHALKGMQCRTVSNKVLRAPHRARLGITPFSVPDGFVRDDEWKEKT